MAPAPFRKLYFSPASFWGLHLRDSGLSASVIEKEKLCSDAAVVILVNGYPVAVVAWYTCKQAVLLIFIT